MLRMNPNLSPSSSSPVFSTSFLSSSPLFSLPWRNQFTPFQVSPRFLSSFFNFSSLTTTRLAVSTFLPRAELLDPSTSTNTNELEFVEIGYIRDVHGLQGEVSVKHSTDFPELRLSEPGKRWLRQRIYGKENLLEVELVEGRGYPGQKNWILKFSGYDSIDEAKQLVGATLLVKESDRPELEEGEFYSRDLIGIRVILKETSEPVGTVVNVFNHGANDLLQVMLDSPQELTYGSIKEKPDIDGSGALIWIPFVEAIVPNVDMDRREMQITPPKGLLQLNLRSDERSKKERRQLWKERKKLQRQLIAAKKKLCDIDQQHVFHGLSHGDKTERSLLADQILTVNSKLLQQAIQTMDISSVRSDLAEISTSRTESSLKISEECLAASSKGKLGEYSEFRENGLELVSKSKLAAVLLLHSGNWKSSELDSNTTSGDEEDSAISILETLLSDSQGFIQKEKRSSVPLIIISPPADLQALEQLFSNHEFFGFNNEKVWFLEEEKLPVVSIPEEEPKKHKILMKSPWEILQEPVGSGGVVTALSSSSILGDLTEMGIEYVEMCCITQKSVVGLPIFLGFVNSCGADIGIQTFKNNQDFEDNFHLIISMKSMMKLMKKVSKLSFHAILKLNSHIEKVDKIWVDIVPTSANSYELHCSIYERNIRAADSVAVLALWGTTLTSVVACCSVSRG
ncbi:hypothetical protein V2J09_010056 [Rumex salicifolius]